MTISELGAVAASNGLLLSDEQLFSLEKYADLLRAKNQVINLISRKDEENILSKHILHSLSVVFPKLHPAGIPKGSKVFDLGTGGGLPGIPIKIARPDISLTLCDSVGKKIAATSEMITALNLHGLEAHTARAEALAANREHRNKYNFVVTRAVAPLSELALWSRDLLKRTGTLIALKGGNLDEEIQKAQSLKFVSVIEVSPLELSGYDEFMKEEKQIVRVTVV
ncbi:MAG: 16S rRNA (guanine(527)-N(7))-methyltransferase RsmG [Ignavibacteriota bacterium]